MKNGLQMEACNALSNERAIQQWAWVRAGGMARFVIRSTMAYSLLMMVSSELTGNVSFDEILSIHMTGIILAFFVWWVMESKYKKTQGGGHGVPPLQ